MQRLESASPLGYRQSMHLYVGALLVLSLAACGSSRPPPATTAPPTEGQDASEPAPVVEAAAPQAQIRLIHAAVESNELQVTLASDGASTSPTAYQFASTYVALAPGHHELS